MNISDRGVATLKNASVVTLKNKYNIVQLKHYIQGADDKSKSTSNEEPANFWNYSPDEIVEIILSLSTNVRPMQESNRHILSGLAYLKEKVIPYF